MKRYSSISLDVKNTDVFSPVEKMNNARKCSTKFVHKTDFSIFSRKMGLFRTSKNPNFG